MSNITLICFIEFLHNNKFIDKNDIAKISNEGFNTRLKIQKYIYLSTYFGTGFKYNYNNNLRGPYSIDLRQEYNNLDISNVNNSVKLNFESKKFLKALQDKDEKWLIVASTILYEWSSTANHVKFTDVNSLEYVTLFKSIYSSKFVNKVFSDLSQILVS